jgi:uncharacterized repeat protein (TIGR04052 family)
MKNALLALTLMSTGALLTGCGSSSSSTSTGERSTVNISIPFKAVANDQPIKCGINITGLGNGAGGAGNTAKISDFRVFVHGITLITDQGIKIPVDLDDTLASQNTDVALLDFRDTADIDGVSAEICPETTSGSTVENPNKNDTIKGSAVIDPAYTISSIQFTLGVPFNLNHENQADAVEPLRNPGLASGMAWNWQYGYKFVGLDVLPVNNITRPEDGGWSSNKWNIHLGSTGCEVNPNPNAYEESEEIPELTPCLAPNRPVVTLPLEGHDLNNFAIQLDYAALVKTNNLSQDSGGAPGCMSGGTDPECEAIFEKFGLTWGDNQAVEQTVFSVVDGSNN